MGTQPNEMDLVKELTAFTDLSRREAEVMVHLKNELQSSSTDKEAQENVARGMGIETSTVDTYYRRALSKIERAGTLSNAVDEFDLPSGQIDFSDQQTKQLGIECPCGSTEFYTKDLGPTGEAIICDECDKTYQVG